ncbi:arginase family protein [Nanoarchaeota archaeon]
MKIIKIPFSGGGLGHGNGANLAPDKIIEQFDELFVNEDGLKPKFEIEALELDENNIEESQKKIYESSKKVNQNNEKAIFLGGDHSVSYGLMKAFFQNNPGAGVIVFDAHPDLMSSSGTPTQEDYLRMLIDEKLIDPKKVILVGIRNWEGQEKEFITLNNMACFTMKRIFEDGITEVCDSLMELSRNFPSLYLSIDIDAVDPAFAPGTGYCEPGGLSSRELLYFLQRLKKLKNLKQIDLVEINPKKDQGDMTSKLGAKILFELYG